MVIVVELEGGDPLYSLTLLSDSLEPNGCALGDEKYTLLDSRRIRLSHLLATCTADISLTAQVYKLVSKSQLFSNVFCVFLQLPDSSVITGQNVTIVASLEEYYGTPSLSITPRINYGQGEVRHALHILTISIEFGTLTVTNTIDVVPQHGTQDKDLPAVNGFRYL